MIAAGEFSRNSSDRELKPSRYRLLLQIPNRAALYRACRRSLVRKRMNMNLSVEHLDAAYDWIRTAHDAAGDGGVPGLYHLIRGWSASYPETTGYLIPTLLAYAKLRRQPEAAARATRMADWEIDVQLPCGAVRSGYLSVKPAPAVFNTGQVLFGWVAAYQQTRDDAYVTAARRAAEWLVKFQDADGAWRRHLSAVTASKLQTYNVRAAWGLALAGRVFDEPRWVEAARRNCEWALTQQDPDGWFQNCAFHEGLPPLLHTIAYTLEGFLGMGVLLGEDRYVRAAQLGAAALAGGVAAKGALAGCFGRGWKPVVKWACLTGDAQTAIVFLRLARLRGDCSSYSELANRLLAGIARCQDLDSPYIETRGAVAGSAPVWGRYCHLAYPNWAAKFYLDALCLALYGADVATTC